MTPAEIISRGTHAERLLNEPLIVEALQTIERDVIQAFFDCPTRDLEGMRILQSNLRIARQFKGLLQGAIERGKLTSNDLREKENFLQQTVRKMGMR